MADDFTLVPLTEARTTLGLNDHFHNRTTLGDFVTADERIAQMEGTPEQFKRLEKSNPNWRDNIRRMFPAAFFVRHYANHAVVMGDLDVDMLPGEHSVAGIVVDGDLELHGSILNWEIDTHAAFLLVRGSLHCRNIIFGCMDLAVQQNVTASGLIIATYNHGCLVITGDVHADRVIIDDDGASIIDGNVYAKGWCASLNAEVKLRESDWKDEIRPEFRDEFFREDGFMKCGNGNVDLVKALLEGRNILRPDPGTRP